jgi:Proliferating cell nuclear antigen, C-terminal domain
MPSAEFPRICRELAQLDESARIEVNREGIRFASEGEIANRSALLKPTDAAHNRYEAEWKSKSNGVGSSKKSKVKEQDAEDADMEEDDGGSIKEITRRKRHRRSPSPTPSLNNPSPKKERERRRQTRVDLPKRCKIARV